MKKIYLILVFLVSTISYSQTNGISYQALILNPNAQKMPGINPANTALINQSVCLQFSIEDETQQLEYKETISTVTDEMGMVNLVIGLGNQTGGYATNFKAVNWVFGVKKLKVGVNTTGDCSSFMEVSDQVFNAVPFAFSAQTVSGIVSIENGGTNASNILDAKMNLNLNNVDNTHDFDKPISNATQNGLDLKEVLLNKSTNVIVDGFSDVKYPTVKALKTYVDNQFSNGFVVDADANNKGKIQLSGDLAGTATLPKVPGLLLKANLDSPAFTGIPNLPTTTVAVTQTAGNISTAIATTAFVGDALTTAINGNFVDVRSDQSIAGTKTFTNSIQIEDQLRFSNTSGAVKWELYASRDDISFSQSGGDTNQFMVKSGGEVSSKGSMTVNESGVTGKGLILSDDGDFVAMNDGYGTLRFSSGVKITDANKGGATVITLGANGRIETTNQLVAGEVTYTNTDGTVGQVLTTDGAGITYWMTPNLPTNSTFVDLTTVQTIAGVKTFETDIIVNGITVGRGNFNENSNTTIGLGALQNNAGYANTAVGRAALQANENASGNSAYGYLALGNNVSGNDNVAVGRQALENSVSGSENTAIGHLADVSVDGISNSVALGSMATVTTSNTIQLGNTNITNVKTSGKLTSGAITYTNTDGSNGQFLSTNGAGTTLWVDGAHEITDVTEELLSTLSQTTFTLAQIPSTKSKVKMYVNGIRISNTAYTIIDNVLTYIPANNGNAILGATERIQFDYFY